jgi:GxxExxY protein
MREPPATPQISGLDQVGHEDTKMPRLRVPTTLPSETEDVITRVIGCCLEVHRELGPGLLERVYARAACIEFDAVGLPYQRERLVALFYRGQALAHHRLDLVVADQIVLEIKCVECLRPVHHAQLLGYLRASRLRAGLLINFNSAVLKDGLKRIVL